MSRPSRVFQQVWQHRRWLLFRVYAVGAGAREGECVGNGRENRALGAVSDANGVGMAFRRESLSRRMAYFGAGGAGTLDERGAAFPEGGWGGCELPEERGRRWDYIVVAPLRSLGFL